MPAVKEKEFEMQNSVSLTQLVLQMQSSRVFVVGDIVLDCYVQGSVSRLSPEAPVPVVLEGERKYVLGGAANVAANIAAMGAEAYLCGRVGDDPESALVKQQCAFLGIKCDSLVSDSQLPTIRKTRILAGYQQLVRLDREKVAPLSAIQEEQIIQHFSEFLTLSGGKALVLSDYGKGVLSHPLCRRLIEMARAQKVAIITDPKSLDLSRYHGTTLIKPNLKEGRELLRNLAPAISLHHFEEEVDAICDSVLREAGAEAVVLSLSEHGVALKQAHPALKNRIASRALQVADVSGAGDTMIAFLAMAVAVKASFRAATEIANAGAALVCAKLGTATLSTPEVLQFITSSTGIASTHSSKVVQNSDLAALAHTLKQNGRRVVFTNGCFDLLHMGHVDLLEKARAFGDTLIVGVNTDASIQRLKGPLRPVQTFESRTAVLAALASVDFVVGFDEDTPVRLIETLMPHTLVKGGDYTVDTVVGARSVMSSGGSVQIIPLVPGHSTTHLVEKARSPEARS